MKIVQINSFSNGSTGTIMNNIHNELKKRNYESYIIWGRGRESRNNNEIFMNDKIGVYSHALYARLTDKNGLASTNATRKMIKKLEEIKPDIIHLHNIHGYYINIKLLFDYIKDRKIKVVWTFHDCWPFTGHCAHFTKINCVKWKSHCQKCPQIKTYPKSYVDNSFSNYEIKKELFTNNNLTIVTPSVWLSKLVKESFLKDNSITVINNGIDYSIFHKRKSDFRKKYNIQNKKIILGVASTWTENKGLNDFIKLSKIIDEDYQIVLIGLSDKQLKEIPKNIIGIKRTDNAIQLAEIYSTADVFFNPTYEENFPTTNLESLACKTPVITYNTGGSPEMLNQHNGYITNYDEFSKNYKEIISREYIVEPQSEYEASLMIERYIKLYESIFKQ